MTTPKQTAKSSRVVAMLKALGAESPEAPPPPPPLPTYGAPQVELPAPDIVGSLSRLGKRKPRQPDAGTGLVDAGLASPGSQPLPGLGIGAPPSLGPV